MRDRTDRILLTVFLVSGAVWLLCALLCWRFLPVELPEWISPICVLIGLLGSAVPAYNLQMLLCRRAWRWVAVLHLLAFIGAALYFTYQAATTIAWEALGWVIWLALAVPPALGCAVAWITYGVRQVGPKK